MRITTPIAKVTFVLAWPIVGLMLSTALTVYGVGYFAASLVGLAVTTGFVVVGVRTFRGRGEAVAAPRAVWRATATAGSSYSLGAIAMLVAVISLIGLILGYARPPEGLILACIVTAWLVLIAAFYLHSGHRIQRTTKSDLHANLEPTKARTVYK